MNKKSIFSQAVVYVSDKCDVDNTKVLTSRRQEFVEARCMLVQILVSTGLNEREIAGLCGFTVQGINKLKNNFSFRVRDFGFRKLWEEVCKGWERESYG